MAKRKAGRRDSKSGQIVEDGKYFRARLEVGRNPRTGRPQYKTARCKSHQDAVTALAKMQTEHGMGAEVPTERSNFGQFLDAWLADVIKPTKSNNTYRQYEWICRSHIKPHLGTKQTGQISRADVQRLMAIKAKQTVSPKDKKGKNVQDRPLSPQTLQHILACLHNALAEAKHQRLTTKNPADDVKLAKKVKGDKKQFLTADETAKFMKALPTSDLADLFAFMISTGTRVGEATGVRWRDLDLSVPNRPLVWIRGQLQRKDSALVYVPGTKTNQERCLPLSKPVADRIKALQQAHFDRLMELVRRNPEIDYVLSGPSPDEQVFLNAEGRLLDPKHVNNRLAELCTEAGVPPISAHKLRHTAATLALSETGDLHGVQKFLGHSQVSLTSDLYGHATAENLRSVTNAIDRVISQANLSGSNRNT